MSGFPVRYVELFAVAIVLVLALLLRVWNLSDLPAGFHGDEAVIGLEAQRILDEGYIGPYSPYAAGQPTGPFYLFAVFVAFLDNTFVAVRIVPALLGTLTVLALYVVVRRSFGMPAALVAATILATMSWHLHFSRIAFPLIAWPLWAVMLAGTLVEAIRTGDWRWWAAAGALTGGGIYIYNAHPMLAFATGLFVAGYLMVNRKRPVRADLISTGVFVVAALLVMIPMIRFATSENTFYWQHFERERVTDTEEWQALDGPIDYARYVASGYKGVWDWLCCNPQQDHVDGSGLTIITPPVMLLLAAFGVVVALAFYRRPLVFYGLFVLLILPFSPIVTTSGQIRRTFVMAPFLALFCAIATIGVLQIARNEGRRLSLVASVAALLILGVVVVQNLNLYFRDFADAEIQEQILGKPIADAAKFLDGEYDDHYVYFLSNIWSVNYATREFLAPEIQGEDRSKEFGEFHFEIDPAKGPPLFVFLGTYLGDIEVVRGMYPGREITPDDFAVRPTFRVFEPVFEPENGFDLP